MTIIGFDVSKAEVVGCRIDKRGRQKDLVKLPNTDQAITAYLTTAHAGWPHLVIGVEATADCHLPLARVCLQLSLPCRLLNPILTKQYTRATVRKRKTDPSDALAIARLVSQGEGSLITASLLAPPKSIMRSSAKLQRLTHQVHLMHARAERLFAESCPELAAELSHVHLTLKTATEKLRQLAQVHVNPEQHALLGSLPGVGPVIATTLLTEIDDISRFHTGKQLVAFAGLDPKVRQSGVSLAHNTRLTKRGSPYLRRSLFIAASVAAQHDGELKAYYQKKRAEGKSYKAATVATARKLTYRLYAVWKRGTPFEA